MEITERLASVFGVMLSAMSCMTAFASYIHEVGYDSDPCNRCGEISVWVTEEIFEASPTGAEDDCPHHRFGTDVEMEVVTLITYECRDCNHVEFDTQTAYYWKCCGFDMPKK